MRRIWSLLLFITIAGSTFGQPYGNEWIDPSLSYWKLNTWKEGIYKVTYNQLLEAGFPVDADPADIQMYHRGKEVAIHIAGAEDGSFDPGEYLLFYGQRNDGTLDSLLYKGTTPANPYVNLFSDTTCYFLTSANTNGKRMAVTPNVSSGHTLNFHHNRFKDPFYDYYHHGRSYSSDLAMSSDYATGEGWTDRFLATAPNRQWTHRIPTPGHLSEGIFTFEVSYVGWQSGDNPIEFRFGDPAAPDTVLYSSEDYSGEGAVEVLKAELPASYLEETTRITARVGPKDNVSLNYFLIKYPQTLSFSGSSKLFNFFPENLPGDISISEGPSASTVIDISDPRNLRLVTHTNSSGTIDFSLDDNGSERNLMVYDNASFLSAQVKPVELTNAGFAANVSTADYIIISNRKLQSSVKQYEQYRSSASGGDYEVLTVYMQDLFNEFSYGEHSPLAIYQFCEFLYENYGGPDHMFLVGKGIRVDYGSPRYRWNPGFHINHNDPERQVENLVPTASHPASDIHYLKGLDPANPLVPPWTIGRLPAKKNEDVTAYLNKVKSHESLPDDLLWRKHLLHLAGGQSEAEVNQFSRNLQKYQAVAEDTVFGGKVVRHIKKGIDYIVDDRLIEDVTEVVNEGVSFITYFGHASSYYPDVDIGFVSKPVYGYQNQGKYPFLLLNGCNVTGTYSGYSLLEDWLVTPNKGAIAAMGHSGLGFPAYLDRYTSSFYKNAFAKRHVYKGSYSIGEVQRMVLGDVGSLNTVFNHMQMDQIHLYGDPSVSIYTPSAPDYIIKNAYIVPSGTTPVTAASDEFNVNVVVTNYGISGQDSIYINLERKTGSNTRYIRRLIPPVRYQDTIQLTLSNTEFDASGLNTFNIEVDSADVTKELDELNNTFRFQYLLPSNAVLPLLPQEYSIISSERTDLVAQVNNLLVEEKTYYIELDTSWRFDSPAKLSSSITADALIRWNDVSLSAFTGMNDTVEFYWRVRVENIPSGADTLWGSSSFTFIRNGPEGWSQSAYGQFRSGEFSGIETVDPQDNYHFETFLTEIALSTVGSEYAGEQNPQYYTSVSYAKDALVYEGAGGCGSGLYALAIDKADNLPYYPLPNLFRCGQNIASKKLNSFRRLNQQNGNESQKDLERFIDSVDTGDYILFVSAGSVPWESFNSALNTRFTDDLQVPEFDTLQNGQPLILLVKKGESPGANITAEKNEEISYNGSVTGSVTEGTIKSRIIGPADEWKKVYLHALPADGQSADFYLEGITREGITDSLSIELSSDSTDISTIDPEEYPYLRLVAVLSDTSTMNVPLIRYWQITSDNLPEGTINAATAGTEQYAPGVLQQGEKKTLLLHFENIWDEPFSSDTLEVLVTESGMNSGFSSADTVRIPAPGPGNTTSFEHTFTTESKTGGYLYQVYVNPEILPEVSYSNNLLQLSYEVKGEKINPVLDVTFDGRHIMDGEIVSPSPMINITVRDENKYLLMEDTSGIEIFLKENCSGCEFKQVNLRGNEIISAGQQPGNSNMFTVQYNPEKLPDGIYTLLVRAKDASGNSSGTQPYRVSFEVINESAITHFYPYPNPFSSSTRFIFTLTGNKLPDDFKIQIMTVSGKIVREIRKEEVGTLRIGNNITDYAWDGRDEYGDQLANGVYLYRVVMKNADDFEHRKTSGDRAFKKEWGKLYILR